MDRELELRPFYKYIWIITKLFNLKYFTHEHKIKQEKKKKNKQQSLAHFTCVQNIRLKNYPLRIHNVSSFTLLTEIWIYFVITVCDD